MFLSHCGKCIYSFLFLFVFPGINFVISSLLLPCSYCILSTFLSVCSGTIAQQLTVLPVILFSIFCHPQTYIYESERGRENDSLVEDLSQGKRFLLYSSFHCDKRKGTTVVSFFPLLLVLLIFIPLLFCCCSLMVLYLLLLFLPLSPSRQSFPSLLAP